MNIKEKDYINTNFIGKTKNDNHYKYNCLLLWSDLITYIGDRYYVQATAKLFDWAN